jgi:DNA-binding NarL/FixJ family response regulator
MYVTVAIADIDGAYSDALPLARSCLDLGRKLSPHEYAHGTAAVLWCLYHLGDWAETSQLVEEHLAAVRGTDVFFCPYMRSGPVIGALIAAHLGDFDRANELLGQVEMSDDEPGLPEALRARVLIALGEAEQGVAAAQAMIDDERRLASVEENDHEVVALVEGLQALGEWDRLRSFLPEARRRSASLAILVPTCDRAEGMVAAADGAVDQAIELLRRAVAGFERLGVPYEIARTKALLANVLPDGDSMLTEAMAMAESLFAETRAAGPQGEAAAPPATRDTSPDSQLTEREREVLGLIGEGISNQQIADRLVLSPRTVERHVSNIYLKLGLEGSSARAAAASHAVRSSLKGGAG